MLSDGTAGTRHREPTLISVLIPLYNEETFIAECLHRVLHAPFPDETIFEVIVVDDGSTDDSVQSVLSMQRKHGPSIRLIRHESNRGKGAAIRTAIEHAAGYFCLIQDADLEYSPTDYPKLLKPLLEGDADAVFGSRFGFTGEHRVLYFWHAVANRILTLICDMAAVQRAISGSIDNISASLSTAACGHANDEARRLPCCCEKKI